MVFIFLDFFLVLSVEGCETEGCVMGMTIVKYWSGM